MVRFGIVGFGLHAVRRLMPGFALSRKCKVTALSRRSAELARQSATEYQVPLAFDSVAALCASPDVDAVLVTTPNSCHLQDVLTAFRAGKPVLCEKPLAMNAAECRTMVEAARDARLLFGVAQVFRFSESVRELRRLVSEGRIGIPVFARSEFSFFADPAHPRAWLYSAEIAGAGPIYDVGVHCIDTLRFILGDEVDRVSASAVSDDRSGEVEAAALLNLEFSRGTLGTVQVSFRAPYRTPIELIGQVAALRADDGLNVEHPVEVQLSCEGKVLERWTRSNERAYAFQVDAFAEAMETQSEFEIPGEDGWQNQEILDAALRSLKSGKAEQVPHVRRNL